MRIPGLQSRAATPQAQGAKSSVGGVSALLAQARGRLNTLAGLSRRKKALTALGIDLGTTAIKVAAVAPITGEGSGKRARVVRLISSPMPKGMLDGDRVVDPDGLADELSRILSDAKLTRASAAIAVGGNDCFVKRVTMPRAARMEALRQLPVSPQLKLPPFDLDANSLALEILDPESTSPNMQALVVAARKDGVRARQRVVVQAAVDLAAVDLEVFAVLNAALFCEGTRLSRGRHLVVDIGHSRSLLVAIENGLVTLARQTDHGVAYLVQSIVRGSAGLLTAPDTLDQVRRGRSVAALPGDGFSDWARAFGDQIRLTAGRSDVPVASVLITGGGAAIEGMAPALQAVVGVPVSVFDPATHLEVPEGELTRRHEGTGYTLALGLALRQL